MNKSQPVLIIDVANTFLRSWCAYPSMSTNGYAMGGFVGFLKTLRYLTLDNQPSRIYCVWEGGGSSRRRAIYPEYKLGSRPEKLNRFYGDDIPDTEENKHHQKLVLLQALKHVPVCQLYTPDCEADDVIAHLCTGPLRDHDKIIVSMDKDMYQLLDEKTKVFHLIKKIFVTADDVVKEYKIPSKNFAIAKALAGDSSDNIDGIKGLGFKSIIKRFPLLSQDCDVLLQEVIDFASSHVDDAKVYKQVVDEQEKLRRNWKLVQLNGSMIPAEGRRRINETLERYQPKADRMALVKIMVKEGLGTFDVLDFFSCFTSVLVNKSGDDE